MQNPELGVDHGVGTVLGFFLASGIGLQGTFLHWQLYQHPFSVESTTNAQMETAAATRYVPAYRGHLGPGRRLSKQGSQKTCSVVPGTTVTDPGHSFCGFGGWCQHLPAYLLRGPKAVIEATAGDGDQSLVWMLDTISFTSLDNSSK